MSSRKIPVKKYCNPITLWSSEKTYFRMNPSGAGWMWS